METKKQIASEQERERELDELRVVLHIDNSVD